MDMECCSDVTIHEYDFKWTINKFTMHLECAQRENKYISLKSSSFKMKIDNSNTKWFLKLLLHGRKQYRRDCISIYAYCEDFDDKSEMWASQKYFFRDIHGDSIEIAQISFSKFMPNDWSWGIDKLYSQESLLEEMDNYLPDDSLTIVCHMNVMGDKISTAVETIVPTVSKNELANDFKKLLESDDFADVTFIVCDTKIPAHRAILAARSPVFAAIFKLGMDETDGNIVHVDNMDMKTFRIMLKYIYTNKVDGLDDVAMDLLYGADKYRLDELKQMCEESLYKQVTIFNAAEMFVMANRYNAKQLVAYIQNFMINDIVDVMKTEGYEAMEREHPQIGGILYRTLVMKTQDGGS